MEQRWKPLVIVQAYEDRPLNAYNGMTTSTKITNETISEDIKSKLKIENDSTIEAAKITKNGIVPKQNGVVNGSVSPKRSFKPPGQPPPPPPMPEGNKMNGHAPIKPKAPPPPPIKKPLQNINGVNNSFDGLPVKPPSTPTPDYDTSSIIKVTNKPKLIKSKSDAVEMQSIESFRMTNPSSPVPRPPSTYFMKQPTDVLTVKKSNPQISVVIGEYPTNTFRKQPSKLEFLSTDTVDGDKTTDESVGSRLQSELIQTLSRSNLRTKTESDGKSINGIKTIGSNTLENDEPNANFYKRYGNNTQLPQPTPICIPKVPVGKSLSHNIALMSDITRAIANGKQELAKTESLPQNGILKNVTTHSLLNHSNAPIKLPSHTKTIKFGQTTTLIGEPENMPISINH